MYGSPAAHNGEYLGSDHETSEVSTPEFGGRLSKSKRVRGKKGKSKPLRIQQDDTEDTSSPYSPRNFEVPTSNGSDNTQNTDSFNEVDSNVDTPKQSGVHQTADGDLVGTILYLNDGYSIERKLGKGGFSTVYKGVHVNTGTSVAIKQISVTAISKADLLQQKREIDLLKEFDHENIVKYVGHMLKDLNLYIVIEVVENGALIGLIQDHGTFSDEYAALCTAQVLEAMQYLHSINIVHRDIKADNLLMAADGTVKVADFGLAKRITAASSGDQSEDLNIGTPYWMAPEVIELQCLSTASDIWSLGCTVFEMLTGNPPNMHLSIAAALYKIIDQEPEIPTFISKEAQDFLSKCLVKDVNKRYTATQLLEHPWIQMGKGLMSSKAALLQELKMQIRVDRRISTSELDLLSNNSNSDRGSNNLIGSTHEEDTDTDIISDVPTDYDDHRFSREITEDDNEWNKMLELQQTMHNTPVLHQLNGTNDKNRSNSSSSKNSSKNKPPKPKKEEKKSKSIIKFWMQKLSDNKKKESELKEKKEKEKREKEQKKRDSKSRRDSKTRKDSKSNNEIVKTLKMGFQQQHPDKNHQRGNQSDSPDMGSIHSLLDDLAGGCADDLVNANNPDDEWNLMLDALRDSSNSTDLSQPHLRVGCGVEFIEQVDNTTFSENPDEDWNLMLDLLNSNPNSLTSLPKSGNSVGTPITPMSGTSTPTTGEAKVSTTPILKSVLLQNSGNNSDSKRNSNSSTTSNNGLNNNNNSSSNNNNSNNNNNTSNNELDEEDLDDDAREWNQMLEQLMSANKF